MPAKCHESVFHMPLVTCPEGEESNVLQELNVHKSQFRFTFYSYLVNLLSNFILNSISPEENIVKAVLVLRALQSADCLNSKTKDLCSLPKADTNKQQMQFQRHFSILSHSGMYSVVSIFNTLVEFYLWELQIYCLSCTTGNLEVYLVFFVDILCHGWLISSQKNQ